MLPGKKYTPEDLLRIGWRYKWLIAVPFVLATAGTVVGIRFVPNLFRSETLILVVPQRISPDYVRPTVNNRIEERLQAISPQILSRTRLEAIINELKIYPVERATLPMEDIVARMRRDIDFETVRGDAFKVSFVSQDPIVAQKVAERLASLFIEENLRDRAMLAEGTSEFLDSQLEEARVQLVEHEKRLEVFRQEHAGELPTQAPGILQSLQTLQVQVQGLNDSIERDRERRLLMERQLGDLTRQTADAAGEVKLPPQPSNGEEPSSSSAAQQLAAARHQLEGMETRLTSEHPDIIRAKRIIRDLQIKAEEERRALAAAAVSGSTAPPRTAAERTLADLRTELAGVTRTIGLKETQLASLDAEIVAHRARLHAIPTRESEMTALMRDYDTLKAGYQELLSKWRHSKVAENLERLQVSEQFKVLDPAGRPEVPFSPNRPFVTAAGSLVGLALGVGLVILLEVKDRSFRAEKDVLAVLGVPVLASVPRMLGQAERQRRRRLLVSGGAAVVTAALVATAVVLRYLR